MTLPAPRPNTSTPTLKPLPNWPGTLLHQLQQNAAVVRVVVVTLRGSAPREAGACMLVTDDTLFGTIGGGYLEYDALNTARTLLRQGPPAQLIRRILGTELGQCCGGVVELWLERWSRADAPLLQHVVTAQGAADAHPLLHTELTATTLQRELTSGTGAPQAAVQLLRDTDRLRLTERLDPVHPPLWVFGAGHVGQALLRIVAELPFATCWIDARPELFPQDVPARIRTRGHDPLAAVDSAPAGSRFVVMTHDHALDYQLVRAILRRNDAAFCGLIGSDSKAARFRARLARDGLGAAQVAQLACPIGIGGIKHKWPAAIAVATAAQLLQTLSALPSAGPQAPGCTPERCPTCRPDAR